MATIVTVSATTRKLATGRVLASAAALASLAKPWRIVHGLIPARRDGLRMKHGDARTDEGHPARFRAPCSYSPPRSPRPRSALPRRENWPLCACPVFQCLIDTYPPWWCGRHQFTTHHSPTGQWGGALRFNTPGFRASPKVAGTLRCAVRASVGRLPPAGRTAEAATETV